MPATTVTLDSTPREVKKSPTGLLPTLACLTNWNYTVSLPLPSTLLSGKYVGTLTHSVA
ncbi:hypothetical protein HQ325_06395 [Rhodococcus sp. BP-349]|uniref:hypothetical protein n=1 Tax=unclassified Rhodococcus (in: high G+C Gram-positive bacteria) TaxID=192944 RepID=UPI001C9B0989|nr:MULTISPECIES: hypothetical protein [unclassified Rhodococcus (in: high G+C Gram-positive bacteria)]MBY6538295.1 hypothetical protein [Rhodococcus sp. BP-363]MBY6542632.1 hypothetical protein [Rhodococcus sp. BP-369]MBY6561862.1 hypothetical protein [Rhodococcus sp. BP-370]MBY6576154.1 hypothetical protein [Rhodococcus sp. BP-364]MBY6585455.1 hypothetical protein [Rhodococcus sp. BP-358]